MSTPADSPGNIPPKPRVVPFKIVFLGESAAGKTSICLRYVRSQFIEFQEATIGAAFMIRELQLACGDVLKFEIWDTAGQERYRSLAPMYYKGSSAAIVVYDITQTESFARAKSWVQELKRQCEGDLVLLLAGNKVDLASDRRVPRAVAEEYATDQGAMFVECSAKTGEYVSELFQMIADSLPVERRLKEMENEKDRMELYENEFGDLNSGGGCPC